MRKRNQKLAAVHRKSYRQRNRAKVALQVKSWYLRTVDERRKKNRIRYLTIKEKQTAYYRLKKYGVTQSQYDTMLLAQSGSCAICRTTSCKTLTVDHNHSNGKIRGLLCGNCNRALGIMQESPEFLRAAADYLELYSEKTPGLANAIMESSL